MHTPKYMTIYILHTHDYAFTIFLPIFTLLCHESNRQENERERERERAESLFQGQKPHATMRLPEVQS
jgi:hypothetical protein